MSEVKTIDIPLTEFGQQGFVDWLRERIDQGRVSYDRMEKIASLPFTEAISESHEEFYEFVKEIIDEKIDTREIILHSVEISGRELVPSENFSAELQKRLREAFKKNYGVSGMVPRGCVRAIISDVGKATKELRKSIRSSGTVSKQALRISCVIVREMENLTNFLYELKLNIEKEIKNKEQVPKEGWHEKLKELKESFPRPNLITDQPIAQQLVDELHELVASKANGDYQGGLAHILDQIRSIRNKIAHPADIEPEEIEKLADLADLVVEKLCRCSFMLARVVEVRMNVFGMVQVGLYLEVDQRRRQPRLVQCEDIFRSGKTFDATWKGADVIVAPVRKTKSGFEIGDLPIILRRDDSIVSKLYQSKGTEVKVTVNYYQSKTEESSISIQSVSVEDR